MNRLVPAVVASWCLLGCGGADPGPLPSTDAGADAGAQDAGFRDAGADDAGANDAGLMDAGPLDAGAVDAGQPDAGSPDGGANDAGWRFVSIPGSQCARGATAGLGYNAGASDQLVVFFQGGGACWNNGTCHPSVYVWGPVCNYGMNSFCLFDDSGGTKPLAVNVDAVDPFPADGGGVFPAEIAVVSRSLLFSRRAENPLRDATYAYFPYCTGDLHAGASTKTYFVKPDLASAPTAITHHFAGAANVDAYLAYLRTQHPQVSTVWVVGVSGGGYGAQLNLHRVRAVFPEASVHLLADSAPMLNSPHFNEWANEWNLQVPSTCTDCDAGLPNILAHQAAQAPNSRIGLLAFHEDAVITRFFFSGADTASWLTPPFATYSAQLASLEATYGQNRRYFELGGQTHVMLDQYGAVLADGGVSAPTRSPDGGTDLKRWVDAWVTGSGAWDNVR